MPVTRVAWVTRSPTTVRHVRGLLTGLEQVGALDYAEVLILPVTETQAAQLPKGQWKIGDRVVNAERDPILHIDNLPPMGVLLIADEELDA